MTRDELTSLGVDWRQLAKSYRRITGIEADLSGDDPATRQLRRVVFDRVTAADFEVLPAGERKSGPKMGAFGEDDPATHDSYRDRKAAP